MGPIALCVAVLIIYVFFIWYRDWFGKNTFIYRLLMLPTASIQYLFSKGDNDFTIYFRSCWPLQLLLFPVESQVLQWMVPNEFRTDITINEITKCA